MHRHFKLTLAAALVTVVGFAQPALAQSRYGTGPFTGYEADALADVWSEIRQAEDFEDINWRAHGLNRAPGSPEAQRLLATNWDELRREERFADIEWDEYDGDERSARSSRGERYGRLERGSPENETGYNDSPFTREEAAVMSRAWGQIRTSSRRLASLALRRL